MYSRQIFFKNACFAIFSIFLCIVFFLYFVSNLYASDFPWKKGDVFYGVEYENSAANVEYGHVMAFYGDACKVKWDASRRECLVPVERLHRTFSAAQRAESLRDTDGQSFENAGKSVGRVGLLFMLLSRRGAKHGGFKAFSDLNGYPHDPGRNGHFGKRFDHDLEKIEWSLR